ncbi:hypothetical protein ADL26_05495, partial [Thermoactinomyces vulgaris]
GQGRGGDRPQGLGGGEAGDQGGFGEDVADAQTRQAPGLGEAAQDDQAGEVGAAVVLADLVQDRDGGRAADEEPDRVEVPEDRAAVGAEDVAEAEGDLPEDPHEPSGQYRVFDRVVTVGDEALVEPFGPPQRADVGVAGLGVLGPVGPAARRARVLLEPVDREGDESGEEDDPDRRPV